MKTVSHQDLERGEPLPWGYGIAWRRVHTLNYVILPIPLNILCNWMRRAYRWAYVTGALGASWGPDERLPGEYMAECWNVAHRTSEGLRKALDASKEEVRVLKAQVDALTLKNEVRDLREELAKIKRGVQDD